MQLKIREFDESDRVEVLSLCVSAIKVNLQVRASNSTAADFYRTIGYRDDAVISLGKRLVEDRSTHR